VDASTILLKFDRFSELRAAWGSKQAYASAPRGFRVWPAVRIHYYGFGPGHFWPCVNVEKVSSSVASSS
jgi:hypothetical protein